MTDRAIQYAQSVLLGEILSGPIVRAACQRHLNDLKSVGERGFYYDEKKVPMSNVFIDKPINFR